MKSIFEMIEDDHREIKDLFDTLRTTPEGLTETRSKCFAGLRELLEVHAEAEEDLLYPLIAARESKRAYQEAQADHRKIQEILDRLGVMTTFDPDFATGVLHLAAIVDEHIQREERDIIPPLRRAIRDAERLRLTRSWLDYKAGIKGGHRHHGAGMPGKPSSTGPQPSL